MADGQVLSVSQQTEEQQLIIYCAMDDIVALKVSKFAKCDAKNEAKKEKTATVTMFCE